LAKFPLKLEKLKNPVIKISKIARYIAMINCALFSNKVYQKALFSVFLNLIYAFLFLKTVPHILE
jgi:IS4 transposase